MPKIFYTERDIEDLFHQGVTQLVVSDDVVVTDLGREQAMKLGFALVREDDQPQAAPIRPYIAKKVIKSKGVPPTIKPVVSKLSSALMKPKKAVAAPKADLEQRVLEAVKSKMGGKVDEKLLATIVRRVVRNLGGK